ncbi:hypothetical protein Ahy_A02g009225 isoform B [Arachis hypogaea]|uniref:Small ribosomal subunit protein uS2 n=2 Tax=Arachis hypogaea TaxID=3818 RepID=A0A445EGD6_ARAHY|nr:hypothetical protein Ahy_A02g009225 isoform B [Arachis hypogaea]
MVTSAAATTAAAPCQLSQKKQDIQMMLAAEVHLRTKNCDFQMERYVFKYRNGGIYIINIGKTWAKLQLADRIIIAIENPQDIIVQSARPYGQRDVLKFAQYTGANAIAGRHTPGTFTNEMQTSYNEPRLRILTDPKTDHQPIKKGALGNIPTIAFYDTDSPMPYVDVGIPVNNKEKHSIGCLFWLLAWMVLQMRGTICPGLKRDVMRPSNKRRRNYQLPQNMPFKILVLLALPASPQLMGNGGLLQLNNPGLNQFLSNPLQLLLLQDAVLLYPQLQVIGNQFQLHRHPFLHLEVLLPLPIKEGALGNIPTIALCDTNSPMRYVNVGIPANNKGKHSIGCLFWLLARMVLQMRDIYIINLGKTWEKLQLAARIIVAIENPQDIIVQSARPYGQRAVLKFEQYTSANAIVGRHTPGTFTNQMQTSYNKPRLLILIDPRTDHQPIKEGALGNIPTIAFCDTDFPMCYVDIGIPANNKKKHSIGCLFWLLARMVLQMKGTICLGLNWDVMVDLFFYREPEEAKQQEEEELPAAPEYAIQDFGAAGIAGFPAADGEWEAVTAEQSWTEPSLYHPSPSDFGLQKVKFGLAHNTQHIVRLQHLFLVLIEEDRRVVVSLPRRCTRRRPCVQPAATGLRELAWRHRRCRPAPNPPLFAVRVLPTSSRSRHSPLQVLAASFSVSIPRKDRHQEWWWISHDWRGSTEPPNSTISAADGGSDGVSTHPCYRSTMGFSLPRRESADVGAAPRIVIRVRRLPRKKPPSVLPSRISFCLQISWISGKKDPPISSSKNKLKTLSWQERRKLERDRKQKEEDEQTLAKVEAPIPQSNIGFKLLKQMGYTSGAALGKEGLGRAEPVGIEIRRSRAGIGLDDPHKEKRKKEEIIAERKRRKEEDLMQDFGLRQKEIIEPEKNEDDEEEEDEEEEEITEELRL